MPRGVRLVSPRCPPCGSLGGVSAEALSLQRQIASVVDSLPDAARVSVAFDGPDAAGKTWLADSVAKLISAPVVRASVDGFHNPAAMRLQRGPLSAEGCYRDSFDYPALIKQLLAPFRGGATEMVTSVFDYQTDRPHTHWVSVAPHAALLFDGLFLLRSELRDHWTLRVYLHVHEHVTLTRALHRDRVQFGSERAVFERYQCRYLPAQAIYQREARPQESAHIVIDNSDPDSPKIMKWQVPDG
jgi:uridine kinase